MKKSIIATSIFIFYQTFLFAQINDIVKTEGITSSLHQKNIGKISFMGSPIDIGIYKESDFINSFTIKDTTDLNIRVYLGNSLTNYLHALSPDLSADDLVTKGNFQFTFYLDGLVLYTENLNIGAFGKENKNTKTVFRVPLISSTNEDNWGRFLWNRFLVKAGEDALTEGTHQMKIDIRPYLKNPNLLVGEKIAEGQIEIIVPKKNVTEKQLAIQKILPKSGWVISNEHIDETNIRALNRKIAVNSFKSITSIIVIKNGKLLLEEYFNNANRNTFHDTRSVGKSFTSALIGIAIKDKYLQSDTQKISEFYLLKDYKNPSAEKSTVSIKNLLTMSSSFEGSDRNENSLGNEENMYPTKNWVKFTLDLPMDSAKVNGKQWDYFTAGVVLLGDIIHKSVPNGLENYANKKLFVPLGIKNYKWQYTPQNVANTAGGLEMNALDFAKFGQLYKNNGVWNKQQILPKDWVVKSLSHQMPIPETDDEFYGYLFWDKTYSVNSKQYETYYSSGNGGNKIYIFKDQPIVVVITSTAYNTPYGHSQVDKIVTNYLIPAIFK